METFELLKTLTATPGPSGMESDIATMVAEIWRPYVDEIEFDRLGNVLATKYGSGEAPRPRLLISAHMDEIALLVTDVIEHNGYGFLRVTNVGGIDRRQLLAQRVMVHGKRNVPGVVGCLPYPMLDESKHGKARDFDDIVIDVGLSAENTRALISIGDFITMHQPVHKLLNNNVATKAVDNRASIAALTIALKHLQNHTHHWDLLFTATVQEEVGLKGGMTVGFGRNADLALALDVSFATQTGISDNAFDLGSGPILDIGVNVHPAMLKGLKDSAESIEMTVNLLPHTRASGTEIATIQLTQAGVPTGLMSIPIRNMHTTVEIVNTKDIKRAGRLVAQFASTLDGDFLANINKELMREA